MGCLSGPFSGSTNPTEGFSSVAGVEVGVDSGFEVGGGVVVAGMGAARVVVVGGAIGAGVVGAGVVVAAAAGARMLVSDLNE